MKKLCFLLLLSLIVFNSCNNNDNKKTNKLTFTNNCESIRGYQDNYGYSSLYSNSGNYSNMLDTVKPYGVTFREKLSNLSTKGLSKVYLSAYVYYLSPLAKCAYCISIDFDGKNLFWGALSMAELAKTTNKWTQVSGEILIPKNLNPNSIVSVFAWNTAKEPFFVDDYEFQFFE